MPQLQELLRIGLALAGGPRLAMPLDVDDPPPSVPIQPTITEWRPPPVRAPDLSRPETLDEAIDRLARVNGKSRPELEDNVFKQRAKGWYSSGRSRFETDEEIIQQLTISFAGDATMRGTDP